MRTFGCLALFLALTCVVGCKKGKWVADGNIYAAVWADDDSGQAYLLYQWQERKLSAFMDTRYERRNYRHQLFVQAPDGSERRAVFEMRDGMLAPELFYMKSQGYLIYSTIAGNTVSTYRVGLDGSRQTVVEDDDANAMCGASSVVPSPDGTVLALLDVNGQLPTTDPSSPPQAAVEACPSSSVTVTFLDANSLAQQGQWSWNVNGFVEYVWTVANEFYVQTRATAWKITSATGPVEASPQACVYLKTSSGAVSASGQEIVPSQDSDNPIITRSSDAPPFGGDDCY